jgi:Fe-S-cluster containining protein
MSGNPATTFVLEFLGGNPLRLTLELPEIARTPMDILRPIFHVADAIHRRSAETLAAGGRPVTCGAGCSACCRQLVPVSRWEALHLAAVVRAMPRARQKRVAGRFADVIRRLAETDLLFRIAEGFARRAHDGKGLERLQREYWAQQIPCPFLEDDACLVYEDRPLACRQYMVTSPPALCRSLYIPAQAHELVLHPADTGGALAAFSGTGITRSEVVPHILSLVAAPPANASSPLPGDRMLGRYLHLLGRHFAGKV